MATGYTYAVGEGKVTTLREFALVCSRGMMPLITMREEPMDAAIPHRLEPCTKYYDERISEAKKTLAEVAALSEEECDARAATDFEKALESHTGYEVERTQTRQRYTEMLRRVKAWKVPERISGLKEMMIEQLNRSIEIDCSESYRPSAPERKTGELWREVALADASSTMAHNVVEREKEIQRTESQNEWLTALWTALPEPDGPVEVAA